MLRTAVGTGPESPARYATGRRHPAGRKHAAESARTPRATHRTAGPAVTAAARRPRRTMHPVH
ncbi:hypothetical protein AB0O67_05740 [Streptomyces sp. NPDC086077]|uniref:hypothetical protein n=1 Tax=Streptomyces sp. NPDC086077 TaxID=3154862 RepID=UPI0034338A9B